MNKNLLPLVAAFALPVASSAQNVFPATGNVGIGTEAPSVALEIKGAIAASDSGSFGAGRWTAEGLDYQAFHTFGGAFLRGNSVNVGGFTIGSWAKSAAPFGLYVSGDTSLMSNVGIGTATPRAKLDVAGDAIFGGKLSVQTLELTSDAAQKTGFKPVDPGQVLEQVLTLPVSRWSYTNAISVTHLGPMAQDFHQAFRLGADDKHISAVDGIGVSLAAIQGLNAKLVKALEAKDAEIADLKQQLTASRDATARRLLVIERALAQSNNLSESNN